MNKITAYMVVRGTIIGEEAENFSRKVQNLIAKGWQPLGPAMPSYSTYIMQTMVKYSGQ